MDTLNILKFICQLSLNKAELKKKKSKFRTPIILSCGFLFWKVRGSILHIIIKIILTYFITECLNALIQVGKEYIRDTQSNSNFSKSLVGN